MIEDNKINKLTLFYVKQNCLLSSTHLDLVVCKADVYILMLYATLVSQLVTPSLTTYKHLALTACSDS